MDSNLIIALKAKLESKSTEELLLIKQDNDETQYEEDVFIAIDQILEERRKHPTRRRKTHNQDEGFFSFRKMVSPIILKVIYVMGIIAIVIAGVIQMILGIQTEAIILVLGAPFGIVIVNILWRVVCEAFILPFSIHEILGSIEKELKK